MNNTGGRHEDRAYDPARDRAYHLGILTGGGMAAWAVHHLEEGRPWAVAWGPEQEVLTDARLPKVPATVSFIALPESSTLVPDSALEPGNEAAHLALVLGHAPRGELRDESIVALGATCLYTHDRSAAENVLRKYPHARPMALQALLVHSAMARSNEGSMVLVHRGPERTDVAVADGGKLLLSNSFPTRTAHDLLYFTLHAAERTGVDPACSTVLPAGTHLSDEEAALLERYFGRTAPFTGMDGLPGARRWIAALEQFSCA
jgi:hypothetical protein